MSISPYSTSLTSQTEFISSGLHSVSKIEPQLKNISLLATELCSVPIALITLFDYPDSYWYTAPSCEETASLIKKMAVSIIGFRNREALKVNGIIDEQKLNTKLLFNRISNINFYTGISIINNSGEVIGHLWVVDCKKRKDTVSIFKSLRILADQASRLIELNEYLKTERKITRDSLIKSESNLKTIIETTNTGYALLDTKFNLISFNSIIEEYACNDLHSKLAIGKNALEIFPETRRSYLAAYMARVLDGEYITYETQYLQPDSSYRWYSVKFIPVKNNLDKVIGLVMSMDNITDQKRIQSELDKSIRTLTNQNKRLLNFSYIVSHNLRSHTSNIKSILQFLKDAKTEDERGEYLDYLESASESLDDTMKNLNEVVSIHNNLTLKLEKIDLYISVEKSIEVLREQIEATNAEVHNNVAPKTIINYNPAYLESILFNFLSNAIKYRSPNRQPIIFIDTVIENLQTIIRIADNGLGIDLEKHGSKLFGMYKTFHGNKDAKGIGLFITKNQVEAMNGRIELESVINAGTTFKIYI